MENETTVEPGEGRSPSVARRRERLESARCVTTTSWPVVCEDFSALADHRFEKHTHGEPHICLVVAGTLLERDGRGGRRMPAGSARLSPAGDAHDLAIAGGDSLRCLVVSIAPDALAGAGVSSPDGRRYAEGAGVAQLAQRLLAELRSLDDASPVSLEMLGLEAMALAGDGRGARGIGDAPIERVGPAPRWLERVRERVRDDLRSVPTLAELAREAGVSRAHLARTFRARYGYTVGQFVRGERLERARRLILRTDTPLATVAFEAGFADQSHMTRLVGSRFGLPPGRLRASRG